MLKTRETIHPGWHQSSDDLRRGLAVYELNLKEIAALPRDLFGAPKKDVTAVDDPWKGLHNT